MATPTLPNYTKLDTNGKEIIYWNALGECGHITLYTVQCFKDDWIFCMRCNASTQIKEAKFARPAEFMHTYGGNLNT